MSPDENITLVSGWIVRADAKPNCRGKRLSASGQLQTFGRRREVVRFVPLADIHRRSGDGLHFRLKANFFQ
jgi:hypothetical protein